MDSFFERISDIQLELMEPHARKLARCLLNGNQGILPMEYRNQELAGQQSQSAWREYFGYQQSILDSFFEVALEYQHFEIEEFLEVHMPKHHAMISRVFEEEQGFKPAMISGLIPKEN